VSQRTSGGWTPDAEEMARYGRQFFRWAGIRILEVGGGRAVTELEVADHHRGGGGTRAINGGIVAYMFDGTLGLAVGSTWDAGVRAQVTLTLTIHYLRRLDAERRVVCTAEVVRRGGQTVFVDGAIRDEGGRLAATCNGIYRLFRDRGRPGGAEGGGADGDVADRAP
jgi:uncharacterized protein (TIGR00369 family)